MTSMKPRKLCCHFRQPAKYASMPDMHIQVLENNGKIILSKFSLI